MCFQLVKLVKLVSVLRRNAELMHCSTYLLAPLSIQHNMPFPHFLEVFVFGPSRDPLIGSDATTFVEGRDMHNFVVRTLRSCVPRCPLAEPIGSPPPTTPCGPSETRCANRLYSGYKDVAPTVAGVMSAARTQWMSPERR